MNNPRLRTMITIYETDHGWRYRVGLRDDGNYTYAQDAFSSACAWLKSHPEAKIIDRG